LAAAGTLTVMCAGLAGCGGPSASVKLILSQASGPVGTVVQVSGQAGGGCSVPVNWHGFRFSRRGAGTSGPVADMTTSVATNGTWSASFPVPAYLGGKVGGTVAPGPYELVAHACKGHVVSTASFQVTSATNGTAPGTYVAMAATTTGAGYWTVQADGQVTAFGDAKTYGSISGPADQGATIVGIARTYDNGGYWLAASNGKVFPFGDAKTYGSLTSQASWGPVVGIAATPTGHGYWLLNEDGRVHGFGNARVEGQPPAGQAPYTAIAARPGGGYIVVAAFDAATYLFPGNVLQGGGAGTALSGAIVGATSTPSGNGAWDGGVDGGVVTIGDAVFHGSASGTSVVAKASLSAIAATPDGQGYWVLTTDGTVTGFGDAHVLPASNG
jgi:hypothetical protein